MAQNSEALSIKFDTILQKLLNYKHLVNSYFRISKGTPEQVKKFFLLNSRIPRPIILIWNLVLIPLNIVKLILILILSLMLSQQNSLFKKNIENTQVVFLSHGTERNLRNSQKDTFFGQLPQYVQTQTNFRCTIVYTNQNIFRFRRNNKLLGSKNDQLNHILLPKFLPFSEHLTYFSTIWLLALQTLIRAIRYYFAQPDISRILICSMSGYFNRTTYSNILLLNRLKEIQTGNNLILTFLTFEGHSYEQLLVDSLEEKCKEIKIILVQHSPIVPLHHGVRSFLNQRRSRITILTTGEFYKEHFESLSQVPNYRVIGTDKSNYLASDKRAKNTNKIIYAPEGTILATKEFVSLIKTMVKECPTSLHYLRLHPDLKISLHLKFKLSRLRRFDNFFLSRTDLDADLSNTNYLVYRSSAVAIESLKYDLLSVFYADPQFIKLNVLFSNINAYSKAENSGELITLLKSPQKTLSNNQRTELFNSYFSALNFKGLINAI